MGTNFSAVSPVTQSRDFVRQNMAKVFDGSETNSRDEDWQWGWRWEVEVEWFFAKKRLIPVCITIISAYGLDLARYYGPNYDGTIFVPTKNDIWDNSPDQQAHHCGGCYRAIERGCYEQLHMAFCTAVVEHHGVPRFCGLKFKVEPPGGCGNHKYAEDYNKFFVVAVRGVSFMKTEALLPTDIPHEVPGWMLKGFGPGSNKTGLRIQIFLDDKGELHNWSRQPLEENNHSPITDAARLNSVVPKKQTVFTTLPNLPSDKRALFISTSGQISQRNASKNVTGGKALQLSDISNVLREISNNPRTETPRGDAEPKMKIPKPKEKLVVEETAADISKGTSYKLYEKAKRDRELKEAEARKAATAETRANLAEFKSKPQRHPKLPTLDEYKEQTKSRRRFK
ncbi:hypothetical protein BDV95DRAFT_621095 [Massariosphaeria phaeospora]|uniref:Uncharacterized protein n=1 Tax=Massariosphaeria phaeospora TaxID=100035 RepID=A0A7C8I1S0_9PLEO|nr:hypothetical protein BDV95DRAFT_621095 [Massariosphaeria phaeospora]